MVKFLKSEFLELCSFFYPIPVLEVVEKVGISFFLVDVLCRLTMIILVRTMTTKIPGCLNGAKLDSSVWP